ncbi:hypothetical protein FRC19_002723 [Serendipita sp. 401]|nr:hypothetical protein FRC16_002970 [Serendipita sp. 398]KAG8813017.1 hypothetical protein FRC19_002723 [Serendipita sp. 401]
MFGGGSELVFSLDFVSQSASTTTAVYGLLVWQPRYQTCGRSRPSFLLLCLLSFLFLFFGVVVVARSQRRARRHRVVWSVDATKEIDTFPSPVAPFFYHNVILIWN